MNRILSWALAATLLGCRSAASWTEEGDRLLRDNRLEEAEVAYGEAIDEDPHHAPALYGKGWVLYASGFEQLRPAARDLFQRAIDYDPAYFGGWRGKGVLLLEEGQLPAAEKALREAVRLAPSEASAIESLGRHYLRARRTADARRLFEAAVAAAPDRGELQRLLAEVDLADEDYESALARIALGRERPVSGRRGLRMLDDIESTVLAEWVGASLGGEAAALEPALALRHLDRADSLLESAHALGSSAAELATRRRTLAALRERVVASPPGSPSPATSVHSAKSSE